MLFNRIRVAPFLQDPELAAKVAKAGMTDEDDDDNEEHEEEDASGTVPDWIKLLNPASLKVAFLQHQQPFFVRPIGLLASYQEDSSVAESGS
jgi:hypothetical protein